MSKIYKKRTHKETSALMNENENLRVRIVVVETIKSNVYFYIAFVLSDSEHMRCVQVCVCLRVSERGKGKAL